MAGALVVMATRPASISFFFFICSSFELISSVITYARRYSTNPNANAVSKKAERFPPFFLGFEHYAIGWCCSVARTAASGTRFAQIDFSQTSFSAPAIHIGGQLSALAA